MSSHMIYTHTVAGGTFKKLASKNPNRKWILFQVTSNANAKPLDLYMTNKESIFARLLNPYDSLLLDRTTPCDEEIWGNTEIGSSIDLIVTEVS